MMRDHDARNLESSTYRHGYLRSLRLIASISKKLPGPGLFGILTEQGLGEGTVTWDREHIFFLKVSLIFIMNTASIHTLLS